VAGGAAAQTGQERTWCYDPDATDNQTIAGCNAVLAAPGQSAVDRAHAFADRGFAYNNQGLYDQAIADLNEAIAISPGYADAFAARGSAYENKGLRGQAISDYRTALRLRPGQQVASAGLARLGAAP
jgi:tetratricopeptide (TPR) repeat protein